MNIILGIETSCDDTGVALVKDGREILGSLVASQVKLHARFGGVVPEVASRKHMEVILALVDTLLRQTKVGSQAIDAIAVTSGPGLLGSLLVGINTAKTLAYLWNKPLIEVDHLIGHIYSNWLTNKISPGWPILALIVSGGHTELVLMKNFTQFQSVGGTRDDAVGEAFDKAAKILGLGYPGGPIIARIAKKGTAPKLPRPMIDNGLEMSFSGLKTALSRVALSSNKSALAHEFQEAIVEVLATKVNRAIKKYHPAVLLLAGGVAANPVLREKLKILAKTHKINYFMPEIKYCADNAAMVALAAYYLKNTKKDLWYNVKVKTNTVIN
ncbi:MAG: tRNA (adenosine(37)-N6)-threonylcarbamoyltransferase complex transferase subunit TsaD [Patescibacteria group bacterium]